MDLLHHDMSNSFLKIVVCLSNLKALFLVSGLCHGTWPPTAHLHRSAVNSGPLEFQTLFECVCNRWSMSFWSSLLKNSCITALRSHGTARQNYIRVLVYLSLASPPTGSGHCPVGAADILNAVKPDRARYPIGIVSKPFLVVCCNEELHCWLFAGTGLGRDGQCQNLGKRCAPRILRDRQWQ